AGLLEEAQKRGQLRGGFDLSVVRMLMLGALTWVAEWYDPEKSMTPDDVADEMMRLLTEESPNDRARSPLQLRTTQGQTIRRPAAGVVVPLPGLPAPHRRAVRLDLVLAQEPASRGRGRAPLVAPRRRQRHRTGPSVLPDLRLDRLLAKRGDARDGERRRRQLRRSEIPHAGAPGVEGPQAPPVGVSRRHPAPREESLSYVGAA